MKTSSAILSVLLAQSAAAFAPVSQVASSTSSLSVATTIVEPEAAPEAAPVADVVAEEAVVAEVEEVDMSIFDPKKRVQT